MGVFSNRARVGGTLVTCAVSVLVGCGGGGASGGGPVPGPVVTPTAAPSSVTTASGIVLDDPSGVPLEGVAVRLDPWVAYATPGPTPSPVFTTATDSAGRFAISAPNGTYLLVIGPDAVNTPPANWVSPSPNATDTPIPGASGWRATIHDRVVLSGQATLVAPTMPPQPLYTPPSVETSGAYRLASLDPLMEVPCVLAYNADRAALSLPRAVVDEWLTENVRAMLAVAENPNGPGQTVTFLTSGTGHLWVTGGANCANDAVGTLSSPIAMVNGSQGLSATAMWFGGAYAAYLPNNNSFSGFGSAEFPIDPRVGGSQAALWP